MKVYLVGGAVRDELLNYPVKERDWVVVGTTAQELLDAGYKQVGRDFPVFLHPKTREEYALARKERKVGAGYHGFDFDSSKAVSLEEDLRRRDLTINAIAKDDKGNLIDPYNGLADLKQKRLRHVSTAFSEDPVRVLRIARFACRYHHLGFTLAEETRQLMYQMVREGELGHLVAERVWQEWEKSLHEPNPEQFIEVLRACGALKVILPELDNLFGVPNKPKYHPEIDSGIHTLLVLKSATKITSEAKIRFAALTHDLGKALTPQELWPSHSNHEEKGVEVINELCRRLRIPSTFREIAILGSRFHLWIHRIDELTAEEIITVFERCDAYRRPEQFLNLLIVCAADAKGCTREVDYTQAKRWHYLLDETKQITAATLIDNFEGAEIKLMLRKLRVERIEALLVSRNNYE